MALIIGTVKAQFFNTEGTFCAGGFVYSYVPGGGTTPRATYPTVADALAETNANTNPIVLDQRGEANIVLQGATRLVLQDANHNQIWSVDNLNATTTNVVDSSGNPLLTFVEVNNAVNGVTITNATTGNTPTIGFTGGDPNVGGNISVKGTANLNLNAATVALSGNETIAGTLEVTGGTTLAGLTVSGTFSVLPAGVVMWYAGYTAPTGWLECDGSAVSRTTYSALYSKVGVLYGSGNGSTTFNLPNQARRTLVGRGGTGTATLANSMGSIGGSETHTLTTPEIPAHTHTYTVPGLVSVSLSGSNVYAQTPSSATSGSTGGGGSHNNMQPSLVLMLIIRAI